MKRSKQGIVLQAHGDSRGQIVDHSIEERQRLVSFPFADKDGSKVVFGRRNLALVRVEDASFDHH